MERGGVHHRLGISATSAPPRNGEVYRTPIEDTFDGIRFEVSRMLASVKDARKEPLVVDTARYLAQGAVDYAVQMGESVTEANQKLYMLEGFHWWCQHYCFFLQDPTGIEYFQTPPRMIRQKLTPVEILEWIWSPVRNGMALSRGIDPSSLVTPEGKAVGDCLPLSQKIIVRDRHDHSYKVVQIGSLKDSWYRYHVVSYNEDSNKFEFKGITSFVNKGTLPVYKITLTNGTSFRCTEDHIVYLFKRTNANHELVTMTAKELYESRNRSKHYRTRFTYPIALRIPETEQKGKNRPDLSDEQLWIEGLYVAEGWSESTVGDKAVGLERAYAWRSKIGMNNPPAIATLKKNLSAIGQKYGEHTRPDGLVTIRMNRSRFTDRLARQFGRRSAEKRFPAWYLSLSSDQIRTLLSAYAIGDGYVPKVGNWSKIASLVYNTSSETLAKQIQFMHLLLGKPVHYRYDNPWRDKPGMYRLYEWKKGYREKLPLLGAVKIRSVEKDGEEECCDINVKDNHNFLLDGGMLVHNCEEFVSLELAFCVAVDIYPVKFIFGGNDGTLHHVWGAAHTGDGWHQSDPTQKGYKLDETLPFDHYDEVEVPL